MQLAQSKAPKCSKRGILILGVALALALSACNAGQILGGAQKTTSFAPQPADEPRPAQPSAEPDSRCKRGIAYNNMSPGDWRALSANVAWFYSWSGPAEPSAIAADAEAMAHYVPMIWGQNQLAQMSAARLPVGGFLLGFNEPNYGSQANLSASAAAALWPKVEAIARAQNMNIVSPAVNYCGGDCQANSPFDWLDQFFASCKGCRVDAIAVHVYMCNPNDVQTYIKQFENRYNKPLWVTEFACLDTANPTAAQQQAYMPAVVAIFEADPMVHRYAWFTGRNPGQPAVDVLAADGALTQLGQMYLNLSQSCAPQN